MKVGVTGFAKGRHIPSREFSHYSGSWEDLASLAAKFFDKGCQGYRNGVWLVPVPCEGFFSGVVQVDQNSVLKAVFEARREGEAAYISVKAKDQKLAAKFVEIVLSGTPNSLAIFPVERTPASKRVRIFCCLSVKGFPFTPFCLSSIFCSAKDISSFKSAVNSFFLIS